jgi:hypothetical protein
MNFKHSVYDTRAMSHRQEEPLHKAFTETHYLVEHRSETLTVLVNQPPPQSLQHSGWLIITADNPHASRIDARHNELHRKALQQSLRALALPMLPTRHVDPAGQWPEECGWLVLTTVEDARRQDEPVDQLIALGQRFAQRALLSYGHDRDCRGSNHEVRLLWL